VSGRPGQYEQEDVEEQHQVERAREATRTDPGEGVAAELRARERELDEMRLEKSRILESSDRRLEELEAQASAATERVAEAERQLDEERARLRSEVEERVQAAAEEARTAEREEAKTRLEKRERELEGRIAEAVERAERAEERAREAEGKLEATAFEARRAAASWLRDRTRALRREAAREAKHDTEEHATLDAERRLRVEVEDARRAASRESDEARRDAEHRARRLEEELAATKRRLAELEARASPPRPAPAEAASPRGRAELTIRERLERARSSLARLRARLPRRPPS
jgi:hypothetical protein